MWEAVADISFEPADDPHEADILIGAMAIPRGRAFANVAYDTTERSETRKLDQALICLNPNERWKIGFGGDAGAYDLRYTIAHEIGHAIGLNHPGPSGQLMGFQYAESFRALQPGDMAGAVALYGSRDGAPATNLARHRNVQNPDMGLR
jgi:predicted Zn-dependent protease